MLQLIVFLKGFDEEQRRKLATVMGVCMAAGMGNATCLGILFEDHLVKDGESECPLPCKGLGVNVQGSHISVKCQLKKEIVIFCQINFYISEKMFSKINGMHYLTLK